MNRSEQVDLLARVERLEDALAFYADQANYRLQDVTQMGMTYPARPVFVDLGHHARVALNVEQPETTNSRMSVA